MRQITAAKNRESTVMASIGLRGDKTWPEIEASATREVINEETGARRRLMTPEQFASTVKTLIQSGRIVRVGSGARAIVVRAARRSK